MANETGGGILVISEGVFGMRGEQGILKEIVALKKKYNCPKTSRIQNCLAHTGIQKNLKKPENKCSI